MALSEIDKILENKILGCLIGGAVGDALGYPVEFKSYENIVNRYGFPGIIFYELTLNRVAEISDDTQMTMYTANGLLINDITAAYLEWFKTQSFSRSRIDNPKCWISQLPELYSNRAPGNTCMSALRSISEGHEAQNNSKGCGGIMRVAPVALFHTPIVAGEHARDGQPVDATAKIACEAARLTHKHPFGYLPAGALAAAIQRILECTQKLVLDGDSYGVKRDTINITEFEHCIMGGIRVIRNLCCVTRLYDADRESEELMHATHRAIELAKSDTPDIDAIRELGEGWTGEEAWYIAVFCAMRHFDSFEDAVIAAVNHSGDSDSTGAITGNLIGAVHGLLDIPGYYLANLELLPALDRLGRELITQKSTP